MKVFGVAGWSGSGKTTLMVELIRRITETGLRVSTIKHAHHAFDIDRPGKDSYRHREAGATEILVSSGHRWALMHELRGNAEATFEDLTSRLSPVDLVLIEGFRSHAHDKLEVFRPAIGKPMLWPNDPAIVAVASDEPLAGVPVPLLPLNDPAVIADFILRRTGLAALLSGGVGGRAPA
jgi:molybdopterin-guanine dinucleotide biosynthesis protein B